MLSFSFAFCNMELSVWHVMSENNANIKALLFFFNLFNTHSGCKVRKKLVTLRSKRRKKLDRDEKRCYQLLRIRLMAFFETK